MKDTSDRQLRAYLTRSGPPTREEFLPEPPGPQGREFLFRVPITNTGATPAYDVMVQGNVMVTDRSTPIKSSMWGPYSDPESATTLGPGQKLVVGCVTDAIVPDLMERIRGLEWWVVIYGRVTYRDAFGEGQYVQFCEVVATYPVGDYYKAS
jgi:hypothetical protein